LWFAELSDQVGTKPGHVVAAVEAAAAGEFSQSAAFFGRQFPKRTEEQRGSHGGGSMYDFRQKYLSKIENQRLVKICFRFCRIFVFDHTDQTAHF